MKCPLCDFESDDLLLHGFHTHAVIMLYPYQLDAVRALTEQFRPTAGEVTPIGSYPVYLL